MKHTYASILTGIGLMAISGCQTSTPKAPAPPPTTLQKVNVPEIVATSDTKTTQGDSLKVTVVPVTYSARVVSQTQYEQAEIPRFAWDIPPNSVYVLETVKSSLKVEPEFLRFQVKINN